MPKLKDGWAAFDCQCAYRRDGADVINFVYCWKHSDNAALAKSHAELIVALGNYADDDDCVCEELHKGLSSDITDGDCCACIAQGSLDRARKL